VSLPPYHRFLGVWKLRLDLSVHESGPAPREETITIRPAGDALHLTAVSVDQKGEHTEVVRKMGFSNREALFLTLVDDRTLESTVTIDGRVVARTRREISDSGLAMKATLSGTKERGKPYTDVLWYDVVIKG
jgi:hypothetical protein